VVAVGKLGYPDLAEKALRDGMCDMIHARASAAGRPGMGEQELRGPVTKSALHR